MSKDVLKNTDSEVIVRVTSEATANIAFTDSTKDTVTPTEYHIKEIHYSNEGTTNIVQVFRANTLLYNLGGSGSFKYDSWVDSANSTSPIRVTPTSGSHKYTTVFHLRKTAAYDSSEY